MTGESPPRLGGEADPDSWHFRSAQQDRPLPNPVGHTFPLLTHDPQDRWRLVGTGFYISGDGLFITARHVIDEVLHGGQQIAPLVILHLRSDTGLFGASGVLCRPIMQCWLGDRADVALGVAAAATNKETGEVLQHWCWRLSWAAPAIDERVATYAFPRHYMSEDGRAFCFHPELYPGTVLSFGERRDRVMIPFPYVEVNCRIHGAASGGPICTGGGKVMGVNCTEFPSNIDHPAGPGFGAQVHCLRDAFLNDVTLPDENTPRDVSFNDLVQAGCIGIADYVPQDRTEPSIGSLVRLDRIIATAPHPEISLIQHA